MSIHSSALDQMRAVAAARQGVTWHVYQNHALDSADCGRLTFLLCGAGCTFQEPPPRAPDSPSIGMGWKYLRVGTVNLETGEVVPDPANPKAYIP